MTYKNINVYYGILLVFNLIIVLKNKKNITPALLSSFLIGNEMVSLLNASMMAFLIFLKKINNYKLDKKVYIYMFLIIMFSIINSIINNTLINNIVSLCYIGIVLFVSINSLNLLKHDICKNTKAFIIIEFVINLIIIYTRNSLSPGDLHYGSLFNAHYMGNWCIVSLLTLYLGYDKITSYIKKEYIFIFMLLFMIYLSDSKTLVICFIFTILLTLLLKKMLMSKNGVKIFVLLVYSTLFIGFGFIYNTNVKNFITKNFNNYARYVYSPDWNYKFYYINNTLYTELRGWNFLTGYGLGQYGSRFANLFAYDSMYRNETSLNRLIENNFAPHHIQNYVKYVRYYNNSFVQTISSKSAILSYPFSSLIAFVGEIGIVGICLFASILNNILKKSKLKVLLYYFFVICFFDNYFDIFLVGGLIFVCLANSIDDEQKLENINDTSVRKDLEVSR